MKNKYASASKLNLKKWYLIDAKGKTLGRLATLIAIIISGKHKSTYVPNTNCGDYVIIINAEAIKVTGTKPTKKFYFCHSGKPGGSKIETFENLQARLPERILEKAIQGMLPKGPLGRDIYRNLKVYKGKNHPHISQNPDLLI